MRPITRTALGAATAAVLAVTAIAPSAAAPPQDDASAKRPLVGSETAVNAQADKPVTVTLVTGDKVLVSTDTSGRSTATALPREDGSVPLLETRQMGKDLYVCPEGAATALAAGRVDDGLESRGRSHWSVSPTARAPSFSRPATPRPRAPRQSSRTTPPPSWPAARSPSAGRPARRRRTPTTSPSRGAAGSTRT